MGSPPTSTLCASKAAFTLPTSVFSFTFGTFVGSKYRRVSQMTPGRAPAGSRRARRSLSVFGSAKDPREEAPALIQLFHGADLERRGQPKHARHQRDRGGAQEGTKALRAGRLLGPRLYGRRALGGLPSDPPARDRRGDARDEGPTEEDVLYARKGGVDV